MKLREMIRKARVAKGWTVKEAAFKIGIGRSTLTRLESGKRLPPYLEAMKIALGMGSEPEQFLDQWKKEVAIKEKAQMTEIASLILPRIVRLGFSRLKDFSLNYKYPYLTVIGWIYGRNLPSSLNLERLSKDLKIGLESLKKAVDKDRKRLGKKPPRTLAWRKNPSYPSTVALLIHQMRRTEKISLPSLKKLGFPEASVSCLEVTKKSPFGLRPPKKRLFDLAQILRIPKPLILAAYLIDKIAQDSKELNLAKLPFETARFLTWHRLMKGLILPQLAKETNISYQKLLELKKGKRLLKEREIDQLLNFFDLGSFERDLFKASWERDQEKVLKKEKEAREEAYLKLVQDLPREKLSEREWEILKLHLREGLPFSEIAKLKSLTRQGILAIEKRARGKIENYRR